MLSEAMKAEGCMNCGKPYDMLTLDGKPKRLRGHQCTADQLSRAADRGEQFEWLEGPCCYGPAYTALTPEATHD